MIGIPFDKVDAELVTQPLKWNPADMSRFMLVFGPISSRIDIIQAAQAHGLGADARFDVERNTIRLALAPLPLSLPARPERLRG